MNFTSLFLFFFGAIGVFNSFLVSLYMMYKKPRRLSQGLFSGFLFFLSERALRSLIYFFSTEIPNWYSSFGPVTFLFIGPFLYLYVHSVLYPKSKWTQQWRYYILTWIVIAVVLHFSYPFRTDPIFYKKYILKAINIQWLWHILMAAFLLWRYFQQHQTTNTPYTVKHKWLASLLMATLLLWCIFFFVSFSYFVMGSITFSLIFYIFYLFLVFQKKIRTQIFEAPQKYINKKIEETTASQLVANLEQYMQTEKPYRNPNLKSADIAQYLKISTHQFSQLLNNNLQKSFATYINEHRIEEAKRLITANTKYTLEAIGNESGFNSKSTFYTTFKRITGMTPAVYRAQQLGS